MATTRGATFAAAERMVNGVHNHAAHGGANAKPAAATGRTGNFIVMVYVGYLTNGSHANGKHQANFAGWQANLAILFVFGNKLCGCAGRTGKLATMPRFQLNIVNKSIQGNFF